MTHRELRDHIGRRQSVRRKAQSALSELEVLDTTERGCIERAPNSRVPFSHEIEDKLDVSTREKAFSLRLGGGPYRAAYTASGKFLLLYGAGGHVTAIDTAKMAPLFERHLGDELRGGTFLHNETYFALAQPKACYIYNKLGVEVHCARDLHDVAAMTFLPDHFLLGTVSSKGILRYEDTSMGKLVAEIRTKEGPQSLIAHDPSNGVVYLAGSSGTVSLWAPRSSEYLARVLCHRNKVRSIKIDESGRYMATSASENVVKVWDVRAKYVPLKEVKLQYAPSSMDLSQNSKLVVGQKNKVEVFDLSSGKAKYLKNVFPERTISDLKYAPYEDVLTVCTDAGMENMVVPGAASATYRRCDAPHLSARERQEAEVRRLLEKIPGDMIGVESGLAEIHRDRFAEEEVKPKKQETPAGKIKRLMKRYYA